METFDVKPASHESATPSDGGSGQQVALDSPRARNVVQSQAILGSPALNAPRGSISPQPSAPVPPAQGQAPAKPVALVGQQAAQPVAPAAAVAPGQQAQAQAKLSKGKLARKVLEETEVVGRDAAGADRSSPRGEALAAAISKGAFQATADALAGPSFDAQKGFQTAFVAAWKALNKGYDDKGAEGQALLDPILQAKFKGNKLGYLLDLREHGKSSCEWAVLLCLGEIEGGMASDDAVVRAFERAAEELDNAKFQVFWTKVETPLKKNLHHIFTSDRRLHRVLAAKDLKEAEGPVEAAEAAHKKAEDKEHAADTKKEHTEAALQKSEAEASAKKKLEKETDTKLDAAEDAAHDAKKSVKRESRRVDERRADLDQSDRDLAGAQTKLALAALALQEANQAHTEAVQAREEAMRHLKHREQREGQARMALLASETQAADNDAPALYQTEGAPPLDPVAEVQRLAARSERAWQRAMQANQRTIEAQAQIEKLEAEHAKSQDSAAKASSAQQEANDSLHRHEAELKARKESLEKAKENVEAAKKNAEAAKAEAAKAEKAVKGLESQLATDTRALDKAKKGVKTAKGTLDERKKDQLAGGTEVKYLAALVESLAGKLNEFDREAIDELREWAKDHVQAIGQAMKPGSLFLVALDAHIKKDRDKEVYKAIIAGKKEGEIKDKLAGTSNADAGLGFSKDEAKGAQDEVTMTALVVDREAQKQRDKKVKIRVGPAKIEHVVLKQQLMTMSPEAREQYLAFSTGASKADLQDETKRNAALAQLDTKLKDECGIVDAKERERMLALFKVAGAGVNYSKLYGLVHTTESKKYPTDDDFGRKALAYIAEFGDGEFHQLRQDKEVLDAVKVCTKKAEINKLVGGLDAAGAITKLGAADGDKAKTDALHETAHWSTLINLEMDKWRVSLRDERNRNDVYMFGHRAQQAALEVAKTKNPQDKDAGKPSHADAQKFVKDVWAGVSDTAKSDMKSQYSDLATALAAGGEVTLTMVLDSIAKFHVGSWKFHVDKGDIKKTIETSKGRELLDQWSNIKEFEKGKVIGDPTKEREFKRTFVLDVNAEKRGWLDEAAGAESLKLANTLRERFKHAAEHDAEFKAGLAEAGYDNTQFNRDKMEFRGLLEKASKQRKGWDVGGFSSKGHVQHQAHREMVGGLRSASKDDQEINDTKGGAKSDHDVDAERDHHFEHEHAKSLDEKKEELELSGEEFDKLRENIRKYTEIAIALIISIAVSAATMGTVPAWAMVLVKVGAIIMADIIKEVVGNAITGDSLSAQKLVTNIAVDSLGAAAGGYAGMGFEQHAGEMNTFLKEFIKGSVTSVTKTLTKDTVKAAAARNTGDVTVSGAIRNQIMGFLVSAASSQIAAGVMESKGLSSLEHDKQMHETNSEPAKQSLEHLNSDSKPEALHSVAESQHGVDEAQSTADAAQHVVDVDHGGVATDHTNVTTDTSHLDVANHQVALAQQHLHAAQQQYHAAVHDHADKATLAQDRAQLHQASAQLHTAQANVTSAQHALEADQAKLEGDEAHLNGDETALESDKVALESANEHLETAKENLEGINKQIEDLEAQIKPDEDAIAADEAQIAAIEVIGKKVDDAADKILDVPVDIIMEKLGERAERKLEKVTPKATAVDPQAVVQHAAQPAAQHAAPVAQPGAQPHGKKA